MYDILCVTNRAICKGDFLDKIKEIAACKPAGIILREKDLDKAEYKNLAEAVSEICRSNNVKCILHSFADTAQELNAEAIHLPMHILRGLSEDSKNSFRTIGASCHSVEEATEAERLGCTYITAGHIFSTDCKKGVEPRGLDFLKNVCKSVSIPVYAIGGISKDNITSVINAGATGVCIMSGFMKCDDVSKMYNELVVNE